MIRLRRPDDATLAALRERSRSDPFTYEPVGVTAMSEPPHGLRGLRRFTRLGSGDAVFHAAVECVMTWGLQRGSGLVVAGGERVEAGAVVAMAAPLPVAGWIDVVCRVIDVVDERDRAGFVYGTLPVHPEAGEESFTVVRREDGTVDLEIVAVSRSKHPLARLAPPITRRLQLAATRRYEQAALAAVAAGG
jgi:uncharacterized protein (UPF0548 family)